MQSDNRWFEEFFNAIYQFTGILDARGQVIQANRSVLKLTGLTPDQIYGKPLWKIPWSALSRQNKHLLKRAVYDATRGISTRRELELHRNGAPDMVIDFSIKPILDEAGVLQIIIAEGRDITQLKHTSEALYQSEARFKTIFEKAGIGILIKDAGGKIAGSNPAFQAMLGYSSQELLHRNYLEITHPQDRSVSRKLFNNLVNGKRDSYYIEKRYLDKNRKEVWCRVTASLVDRTEGQDQYVIAMVENFSEQKQIAAELLEMQKHIMLGREAERLRLAQDLHDGPLQEIIGISYQMNSLKSAIIDENTAAQMQDAQAALQQLTDSIRQICGELRPPTLIPFGLEKTILSHVVQAKISHPELNIEVSLVDDSQTLPEPLRIVLFRVYQEAFNNIVRHAHAQNVWVRFWLTEERAYLEIRDDGAGFELPKRWINYARKGHLGLVGAMERVGEVGGSIEIKTAPGRGTRIRANVPLQADHVQNLVNGEEKR